MKLVGISEDVANWLRISALYGALAYFIRDNPEYFEPGYSRPQLRRFAREWVHGQRSTNLPDWVFPVLSAVDRTAPKDW
jgi:hypothetical protein